MATKRAPQKATKNAGGALGKAIQRKTKYKNINFNSPNFKKDLASRHTTPEGTEGSELKSITQHTDLEELLHNATLADTEFTAERELKIISPFSFTVSKAPVDRSQLGVDLGNTLPVPRRPKWDTTTTKEQLITAEKQSFLEWRRGLNKLEEEQNILMTPFEKNLEVWRQLWRVLEKSDIIIQIVDGRDPLLFRSIDLDNYAKDLGKKTLLLINKADFLSQKQRELWSEWFQKNSLDHLYWSAAQEKDKFEGGADLDDFTLEYASKFDPTNYPPTHVYQRNELLAKIFHLCNYPDQNQGRRLVVGFVGYPNVGKSSTLNILCRQKRVAVSATPGKTKHFQTILIGEILCLCDCPGLVFPSMIGTKEEMYCNGLLPIDQMRDSLGPIGLVCQRIPRAYLEKIYGIRLPLPSEDFDDEDPNRNPTPLELLQTLAYARGFMRAGHGTPDESRAARLILKDYVNAKLLYCHPPPNMNNEEWLKITVRPDCFKETLTTTTTTTTAPPSTSSGSKNVGEAALNRKIAQKTGAGKTYVEDDTAYNQQEYVSARVKDRKAIKNRKDTKFTRVEFRHSAQ